MMHEPRSRQRARWMPDMEPDRRSLQTLFAFAYGMQVGRMRRIASELQKLTQQAQLATMASGAAIAIAAQNQIECIARSGGAAPQLGSKPEATVGLSGECIRTGIPQFCADTETHPFVDRMHSRTFGVRSIVYVPLFRGVQPAGVIGVFSDKPGHFTQHDMRVLQLIGREVTKLLKWEPNTNALFPPVSTTVTPPPPAAIAAAAEMPLAAEVSEMEQPAPTAEAVEAETSDDTDERISRELDAAVALFQETEESDGSAEESQHHVLFVEAQEILNTPLEAFESADPQALPAAPTEEPEAPAVPQAGPAERSSEALWTAPEEVEYSATVPSFMFAEEHGLPRWATMLAIVVTIATVIGIVWWLAPSWGSGDSSSQMVYGPPQVTKDTEANTAEGATAPSSDLAAVGSRPGLSELPSATANAKTPLVPSALVKTVKTQIVGSHTFVSVHLSGPAQFQAHELTNPDRIYVDLHGVEVSPELKDAKIAGVGPVADFRFSKSPENVVRLVMVLDAPCTYLVSVTSDPYVIVFDVQPLRMPRPGAAKRNAPAHPGA